MRGMNIGEETWTVDVEPIDVPAEMPAPEPEREPDPEPAREPVPA
jgi:hypothetical protein